MSDYALKGAELKKILENSKNGPVSFGFNPGKSIDDTYFGLHKTKPKKALGEAAKKEGKSKKFTFGTAQVVENTLRLTCEQALPQMAKQVKKYLKSQKVALDVEILDASGNVLESDVGEDLADDGSVSDGDSNAALEQAELDKRLKVLAGFIKSLPKDLTLKLAKPFQQAVASAKAGDIKGAKERVDRIQAVTDKIKESMLDSEAAKTFGESKPSPARPSRPAPGTPPQDKSTEDEAAAVFGTSQPSPVDPVRLRALNERMIKLAKTEVPPMLIRLKAQVLQKAKALVDSGNLDDAGKLLDGFEAKAVRPGQSPKAADWSPKKITFEGIDFADSDKMMDFGLKIGEELRAMMNLIDHKIEGGAGDKWNGFKKTCKDLLDKPTNVIGDRLTAYEKKDDKAIADALASWQDVIKRKKALADSMKALWEKDQRARFAKETEHNKSSSTMAMAAAFGDDFLEMTQMAEVQAKSKGLDLYEAKDGGMKEPMEMGEVAAIYGYSTQDYTKVNGLLRGKKDPGVDPSAYMTYIESCKKGLAKLPPFKGMAVRCDKTAKYFLEEVIDTGRRTEKAFLSTGTVKAQGFGDIVTHITKVKTGKEISAFSLHPKEEEVLFPPGSVFKFVKFVGEHNGKKKTIKKHKELAKYIDDNTKNAEFHFEQVR